MNRNYVHCCIVGCQGNSLLHLVWTKKVISVRVREMSPYFTVISAISFQEQQVRAEARPEGAPPARRLLRLPLLPRSGLPHLLSYY